MTARAPHTVAAPGLDADHVTHRIAPGTDLKAAAREAEARMLAQHAASERLRPTAECAELARQEAGSRWGRRD